MKVFKGHTLRLLVLRVMDDKYLLSCGQDAMLKMWNIHSGKCVRTFLGHERNINSIDVSNNRKYILTGSSDTTAKLWEIESGLCVRNIQFQGVMFFF